MRVLGGEQHEPVRSGPGRLGDEPGHRVELLAHDAPQCCAQDLVLCAAMLGEHQADPVGGAQIGAAHRVGMRDALAELGWRRPRIGPLWSRGTSQFFRHVQPFGEAGHELG
ncbi:hypothetical protein PYK79_11125 [Streptomyces sp. ID05-04B]|nr:hypothetical protein [Streptomyces sp. ID05-04B]